LEEGVMSAPAQTVWHGGETAFLQTLRRRYEAEGFTFTVSPDQAMLPAFLGSYQPDAVAWKPGMNIAIEVKRHQSAETQRRLQDIRRLFDGHPDWQFSVVFTGSGDFEGAPIPVAPPAAVRGRMEEVRTLVGYGCYRAAFIMAWALLEAALRSVGENRGIKPFSSGTVVQVLAMNGYIGPDMEPRLRTLVALRHRIVHGDIAAEPAMVDVDLLLTAIEETLAADAAVESGG
jgi:hypothetical protein